MPAQLVSEHHGNRLFPSNTTGAANTQHASGRSLVRHPVPVSPNAVGAILAIAARQNSFTVAPRPRRWQGALYFAPSAPGSRYLPTCLPTCLLAEQGSAWQRMAAQRTVRQRYS